MFRQKMIKNSVRSRVFFGLGNFNEVEIMFISKFLKIIFQLLILSRNHYQDHQYIHADCKLLLFYQLNSDKAYEFAHESKNQVDVLL